MKLEEKNLTAEERRLKELDAKQKAELSKENAHKVRELKEI